MSASAWELTATSFSWTREIMRARQSPCEIVEDILDAGLVRHLEVELGQCFRSFPTMADAELAEMRDVFAARGAGITNVGVSLDEYRSPTERLTDAERLAFVEPQLRAARALGASGVTVPLGQWGAELLTAAVPLLEELDLVLHQEVQGAMGPGSPGFEAGVGTLGICPERLDLMLDTSLVTPALPVTYLERLAGAGLPPDFVRRATDEWGDPATRDAARQLLRDGGVPPAALALFITMVVRFGTWTMADLSDLLPAVGTVQVKFWDLDDADRRVSGPLRDLTASLRGSGFTGSLCSEWGGHDWYQGPEGATEMTTRHLALVRDVLGASAPPRSAE